MAQNQEKQFDITQRLKCELLMILYIYKGLSINNISRDGGRGGGVKLPKLN
jgi:hypothetical protein